MSTRNPTPLRVGMKGTLLGNPCRIAGRLVLGMEEEGEIYYWTEFNVLTDSGENLTLVYEATESGAEWRIFRLFEPDYPISAADAATKRVGDTIYLDDDGLKVTCVDESRVYHIEGEAPEGVTVGDVAHYFNAERGQRMIVVSWTGDEVECFRGQDVNPETVFRGFNVTAAAAAVSAFQGTGGLPSRMPSIVTGIAAAFLVLFLALLLIKSGATTEPEQVRLDGAIYMDTNPGRAFAWDGRSYTTERAELYEVSEVNRRFMQHQIALLPAGVLVNPLTPGFESLMVGLAPEPGFTPQKAASLKAGEKVLLGGETATVTDLFQTSRAVPGPLPSPMFGLVAKGRTNAYLVQWTDKDLWVLTGPPVKKGTLTAALGK